MIKNVLSQIGFNLMIKSRWKGTYIKIGDIVIGYCNGSFGVESHGSKRVEGIGLDWIVARDLETSLPVFCKFFSPEEKVAQVTQWFYEGLILRE